MDKIITPEQRQLIQEYLESLSFKIYEYSKTRDVSKNGINRDHVENLWEGIAKIVGVGIYTEVLKGEEFDLGIITIKFDGWCDPPKENMTKIIITENVNS